MGSRRGNGVGGLKTGGVVFWIISPRQHQRPWAQVWGWYSSFARLSTTRRPTRNGSVTARFHYCPFEAAAMPIALFTGILEQKLCLSLTLSLALLFCQSSLPLLSACVLFFIDIPPPTLFPWLFSLPQSYLVSFRILKLDAVVLGKELVCVAAEKTRWIITLVRWDPVGAVWMTRQQVPWAFGRLSLPVKTSSLHVRRINIECVNAYCLFHVMMVVVVEQVVCLLECGKLSLPSLNGNMGRRNV